MTLDEPIEVEPCATCDRLHILSAANISTEAEFERCMDLSELHQLQAHPEFELWLGLTHEDITKRIRQLQLKLGVIAP